MSAKFYTLLTEIGAAKLASAAALGVPLKITQMAVGDGRGVLPTPSAQQTKLVAEKRRAALNMLYIDPQNSSQIIAEQVIPETEGGWWIREVGLFDELGALIAVGNCPESYKPQLAEGSGRTQTVRMVLITSSTDNITLKIDPSVVLATRKYVDDKVVEVNGFVEGLVRIHEQSRNHPDATTAAKGFVQLNSSVTDDSEAQAATTKAVKIAMDNASARLAKDRNLADLSNPVLAKQNLKLGAFNTDDNFSSVSAPRGGVFFYITPDGQWGVQDSAGNPLPLAIANGGTEANTLLGARVKLGIASFSGDGTLTTMTSPDGKVYLYIDDDGHWGVQDSVGNPLPLAIANGGTGANTLLGARVQLGVSSFGSDDDRSTMSSPGATAFVFINKNGDWGALDLKGKTIPLPLSRGGLGATDAAGARTALQLGSAATKSVGTGSGQIPDMSAFQYSALAKGYEKLPNGTIRQWGTISIPAANAGADVFIDSFAIPFPNGVLNCRANGTSTMTDTPCFAAAEAISKTEIRLKAIAVNLTNKTITQGMAVSVAWEAIGA